MWLNERKLYNKFFTSTVIELEGLVHQNICLKKTFLTLLAFVLNL
jgi:hypothetical protein